MSDELSRESGQGALEWRWRRYAAVGAAAIATQASAQVNGTVAHGVVGPDNSLYEIDLDGNGSIDFSFAYEPPEAASIGSISDPFGDGGVISPPDGLALPGKIVLTGADTGWVVAASVDGGGGSGGDFHGASIFQNGQTRQFLSFESTTSEGGDPQYQFVGAGLPTANAGVLFSNGEGIFSSNEIAHSSEGTSFLGVILASSGDEHGSLLPGFIAVNRSNAGLEIRGWAHATNPTDLIEFAVPVPEVGTVGGLAALAAGAAGLRAWRRRRKDEATDATQA